MKARGVTDTLELALTTAGLAETTVVHQPRLLSDNGSSYIAAELADWIAKYKMTYIRGAPYHPMTQGKIERWHQTPRRAGDIQYRSGWPVHKRRLH